MNSIIDEIVGDIVGSKSTQIRGLGQATYQGIGNVMPKTVNYSGRTAAEQHIQKNYGANASVVQAWGVFPDNITGHSMGEVVNNPQLSKMIFRTWDNRVQTVDPGTVIVDVRKSTNGKYTYIVTK